MLVEFNRFRPSNKDFVSNLLYPEGTLFKVVFNCLVKALVTLSNKALALSRARLCIFDNLGNIPPKASAGFAEAVAVS